MHWNCRKQLMITRKTRKYNPKFVEMKTTALIRINLLIFMILCFNQVGTGNAQYNYKTALGLRLEWWRRNYGSPFHQRQSEYRRDSLYHAGEG
jgi:hypothetical protein